jgi:hypothetical protein
VGFVSLSAHDTWKCQISFRLALLGATITLRDLRCPMNLCAMASVFSPVINY